MDSPVIKIIGLVAAAIAHYLSATPPQPSATSKDEVYKKQSFEHVVIAVSIVSRTLFCLSMVSEAAFVAVAEHPAIAHRVPGIHHALCPIPSGNTVAVHHISSLFAAGVFLSVLGAFIRVWTYRVLGELFTYQVTIRPNHTLITRAPYNIVRHPSYSGLFINIAGLLLMLHSQRRWNDACGSLNDAFGRFAAVWPAFWIFLAAYTIKSVWKRGAIEDEMMRKRFGDSWMAYRHQIAYKFFPGLV